MERKVITAEEMKSKMEQVVAISGYEESTNVFVKLRRISLLALVKSGKIPNQLMGKVQDLFGGNSNNKEIDGSSLSGKNLSEMTSILDTICECAMVEPKYDDVKEYLTDEQKNDIFNWTQTGVENLKTFRDESGDNGCSSDEQNL